MSKKFWGEPATFLPYLPYYYPDGIPELFEGNLNVGSDISDWIRREVTADEIEVNL